MDLFDVVKSCFRRWYVTLPLLLITAWASYHIYDGAKLSYYSNAVVGIAPPNTQTVQTPESSGVVPRNGLLDAGGPTLIANMASLSLRNPNAVAAVVAFGGQPDYATKMFTATDGTPSLPFIMIEAEEGDSNSALTTVGAVVAQVDPVLRSLQQQAGVPDDQLATSLVVSPPSAPVAGTASRMKSTFAVLLAGVGISVLAAAIIDLLILRRRAAAPSRGSQPQKVRQDRSGNGAVAPSTGADFNAWEAHGTEQTTAKVTTDSR